jgi:peptidase E
MNTRKIVAIGGGENWRLKEWKRLPYETWPMDQEIIRLTWKEHPNFLLLAHSQPLERQEFYFTTMRDIYGWMYWCECKDLKSDKLADKEYVKEIVNWADIIYEWWWDTLNMIKLWKEVWFDAVLKQARESGKVMCWVSAWGNCRFNKCSSDSLKIMYWPDQPLIWMDCLWFVNWLFVPHADEPGRQESVKELLEKEQGEIWLLFSNCAALEIVDNEYRMITSEIQSPEHKIEKAFWKKTYRKNGEYIEENLEDSEEFKSLSELYAKL